VSTAAQIIANQKNAQQSTGPRTDAGKAASSQNAVKHGATSHRVLLAWESPAEFERVTAEFRRQFLPATDIEYYLIDDMVAAHWRMLRMQNIVRTYMDRAAYEHPSKDPMIAMADVMLSPEVAKLQRYENTFRRAYENAWAKLKEVQRSRAAQNEPKSARPQTPNPIRSSPDHFRPNAPELTVSIESPTSSDSLDQPVETTAQVGQA